MVHLHLYFGTEFNEAKMLRASTSDTKISSDGGGNDSYYASGPVSYSGHPGTIAAGVRTERCSHSEPKCDQGRCYASSTVQGGKGLVPN